MTTLNDKDIIAVVKKDTEKGFRALMAKYKEPVYWHIRRLVVSHDDAQDAAQETFVRIFRSFHQLKEDSSLQAWIYRIATNEAMRMLERHKGSKMSLDDPETGVNAIMADEYVDYSNLEAVRLQKAILSLPTRQQLTFNLRYYDELAYDEIAAITSETEILEVTQAAQSPHELCAKHIQKALSLFSNRGICPIS